jgi:hypothetical protein
MSVDKAPKKVKICIIKLTVAGGETRKPGAVLEVEANDAARLIHHGKAKKYESGDEKKFSYESPKELAKKEAKAAKGPKTDPPADPK